MPFKKGHSPQVVSQNIKEMMGSGRPQKQAIAASLASARKYKKMWKGGMYGDGGMVKDGAPILDQDKLKQFQQGSMFNPNGKKKMAQGGMVGSPEEYDDNEEPHVPMYAEGGMVGSSEEFDDNDNPNVPHKGHGAMRTPPKQTSMAQMDKEDPEDYISSIEEERLEGTPRENEVENPNEQEEAALFAQALRRKREMAMSPENYAMGGLVQPDHDPDMGNKPSEDMQESESEEPQSMMPGRGEPMEHRTNIDPMGSELSSEAKEAIMRKKKGRRYPSVT